MFLHIHLFVGALYFIITALHHKHGNHGKVHVIGPELSPRVGFVRSISQAQCETYTGRANLTFAFTYLGTIFMSIEYMRTESWMTAIHMALPLLSIFPLSDHELGETLIAIDMPSILSRCIHIGILIVYVYGYTWVAYWMNPTQETLGLFLSSLPFAIVYFFREEYFFYYEILFFLGFAIVHLKYDLVYPTLDQLYTVPTPWDVLIQQM